jgi:hypothetical protein
MPAPTTFFRLEGDALPEALRWLPRWFARVGQPVDLPAFHQPPAGTSTPLEVGATPLGHGALASAL